MARKPDLTALGAQFREASESIAPHRRRQAIAEQAQQRWLKRHRGIPSHLLYDRDTGEPIDPELAELHAVVDKARRDVDWCRAVTVASGEAFKGEPFEQVVARNAAHRDQIRSRV